MTVTMSMPMATGTTQVGLPVGITKAKRTLIFASHSRSSPSKLPIPTGVFPAVPSPKAKPKSKKRIRTEVKEHGQIAISNSKIPVPLPVATVRDNRPTSTPSAPLTGKTSSSTLPLLDVKVDMIGLGPKRKKILLPKFL